MIVWGNFQVKRPFWTCKLANKPTELFRASTIPNKNSEFALLISFASLYSSFVNGLCANVKRTAHDAVLFGEGISFLMGCSKNYIMYWGVTSIY